MSEIYTYPIEFFPNVKKIAADVEDSEMTDKDIQGCKYLGKTESPVLSISFDTALAPEDKTILDDIVANSGVFQETKSREVILGQILEGATSQEQLGRLFTAVRNDDVFVFALDNYNYALARQLATAQEAAGTITQADLDMVLGIVPVPV